MTAASPTGLRRHRRLSSLETLGFLEAPYDSSRVRMARPQPAHVATTTVPLLPDPSTQVGRHLRQAPEPDDLFARTLVDWAPQETSPRLRRRDFRWTVVLVVLFSLLGAAGAGYWLYQRPAQIESSAVAAVESDVASLIVSLEQTRSLAEALATGETVPGYDEVLSDTEATARDLFADSAQLAADDDTRSLIAEGAGAVLEYTGRLNAAVAFRSALEPALAPPTLETDPRLVDLVTAAGEFGQWRAHLDDVAEALPDGVDSGLISQFQSFRLSLSEAQTNYLDAVRVGDGSAMGFVLRRIDSDLATLAGNLETAYAALSGELVTAIEGTSHQLSGLLR